MANPLFVIAVNELGGDLEERAAALARVLGLSLFEARGRVQPPAPRVVASFAERASAEPLVAALAAERLGPLLLAETDCEDDAARMTVRGFEKRPTAMLFESRDGQKRYVDDRELRVVLKVTETATQTRTDKTTERHFSLGKAVMTGGLLNTRKTKVETTTTTSSSSASLYLFTRDHPTFVFRESDLQFQGLGSALQPTRQANWLRLVQELRARTPIFDDRLAKRAGQNHVLGGVLAPDRYLDVAIALVSRSSLGT